MHQFILALLSPSILHMCNAQKTPRMRGSGVSPVSYSTHFFLQVTFNTNGVYQAQLGLQPIDMLFL